MTARSCGANLQSLSRPTAVTGISVWSAAEPAGGRTCPGPSAPWEWGPAVPAGGGNQDRECSRFGRAAEIPTWRWLHHGSHQPSTEGPGENAASERRSRSPWLRGLQHSRHGTVVGGLRRARTPSSSHLTAVAPGRARSCRGRGPRGPGNARPGWLPRPSFLLPGY